MFSIPAERTLSSTSITAPYLARLSARMYTLSFCTSVNAFTNCQW